MVRKYRHPEREILELVDGSLAAASREAIEAHLAECNRCAAVAGVVGALKRQVRAQPRSMTDLRGRALGDSGPVSYGSGLPVQGGPGDGSSQTTQSPAGRKDLEFKDLLQDANLSRPILTQGWGSSQGRSESTNQGRSAHLDTGELASFFYGELPKEAAAAAAGHVAMCSDCSNAISLYRDSDAAAEASRDSSLANPDMSEDVWRLIREWEENCLAELRPESEALSREMLEKFVDILRDHKDEIDRVAAAPAGGHPMEAGMRQIVPVVVLDSAGGFRGVEPFHRLSRPRGLDALECQAPPGRFHNLPIHVLLGAERKYPMVISGRINRGTAELDYGSPQASLMRPLGYFIVEN